MRIPKSCLSVYTPRKEITLASVNISPTVVNDASMEWSSRVLQHAWNPENLNHLSFVNISRTTVIV